MNTVPTIAPSVETRARMSLGGSAEVIYGVVADIIRQRQAQHGTLVDVGCGTGALLPFVRDLIARYRGADAVRYESFPVDADFVAVDLDSPNWPIENATADVTVAIETIEHLENPRAFFRELVRITRPGGLVVVTTPNQLSLLSKITLLLKNNFNAFQDSMYPAHRTALLETDLRRIAAEVGLSDVQVRYTNSGRVPGTARHWPIFGGRLFSDNVAISGHLRPTTKQATVQAVEGLE